MEESLRFLVLSSVFLLTQAGERTTHTEKQIDKLVGYTCYIGVVQSPGFHRASDIYYKRNMYSKHTQKTQSEKPSPVPFSWWLKEALRALTTALYMVLA